MPKLLKALFLAFVTLGGIFSATIQAQGSNPSSATQHDQQGYLLSATPIPDEVETVQTQEARQFDRAIINTGTQNSGAFLQDKDGFLWIGTFGAGLFRFDGYDIKIYKPGGEDSLSDSRIFALYEDRDGILWIGTGGGGLNRYDKKTDSFTQYKHDPQNPQSISGDSISAFHTQTIKEDLQGNLWIGTQNGLSVLDKTTGVFKSFHHDSNRPDSVSNDNISALLFDSQGVLWVGTEGGGLNRFNQQTETFTRYLPDLLDPTSLGGSAISSLEEDRQGYLWIATWDNGFYKFDRATETFTTYLNDHRNSNSLIGNKITSTFQDLSGMIWIAYNNSDQFGLSVFDPQTDTFTHYTNNPDNTTSLSSTSINSVYQDHAGIIWIVNNTGLVDKLDPHNPKFNLFRHNPDNPNCLSSNVVVPMLQDLQGKFWIGTDVNLQKYDKQTGIFTDYLKGYYSGLYEDAAGTFWLGSNVPGALHIFDRNTQKIKKTYSHDPQNLKSLVQTRQIFAILGDNQNEDILWIATSDAGLDRFQKSTETFTHYINDPQNSNSLSNNNLMMLYQDKQGILWIPTSGNGLDRFDPASQSFNHFMHNPQNPDSLSSDIVNVVFEDAEKILWVGTAIGFDRFDRQAQTFKRYTSETGYPLSMIASINQDNEGNLWMGSLGGDGLIKFDPKTETMRVYKESDGLQGNVFYPLNGIRDRDGMMWFGGSNGLNAFYPQEIHDNIYVPSVVITALKQGGESLPMGKSPERVQQVTLDWQHNFFEFEYAALNYTQSGKNQYKYKLEGLDKDWFYAGTRRFGRYSGLRGGDYTLRILGSNNDGVWNEQGVSIWVKVLPPWWETWWFYTLAAIIILGIFLLLFQVKNNQINTILAAAQATQESEERYRTLFENTPMGIVMSSLDGKMIAFNNVLKEMIGNLEEEMRQNNLVTLYQNPRDRDRLLDQVREKGIVRNFETVFKRQDGSPFYASITTTRITLAGQASLLAVVEDITERKRAEEALVASERNYREIFNAINDAVFIHDAENGAILDVNHGMEEMFQYTREEALQLDVGALSQGEPPYTQQDAECWVRKTATEGPQLFEWLARRKDGELFWVEMSLKAVVIAGRPRIMAVARDITERKRMEEALSRERALLERVMETSPIGITFVDRDGQLLFANLQAEKLLGLTRDEIAKRTYNAAEWKITDFVGNSFPEADLPFVRVMTSRQPVYDVQHAIEWPDGRRLFLSINAAPLLDESGQIEGMVASLNDITERKRAEEELLREKTFTDSVLNSLPTTFFMYDSQGVLIRWNEKFLEQVGVSAEEVKGSQPVDFILEKDRPLVMNVFQKVFTEGRCELDAAGISKDNRITQYHFTASRMIVDGKAYIVGAGIDITDRKRIEESLQQANLVVENSPVVLFRWKPMEGWPVELVSKNVNQFGYTPEELLSGAVPFSSLVYPEDLNRIASELNEFVKRGIDHFQQEYRLVTKDGKIRWVDDHTVIERDADGQIMCYQGIVIDVTERKQADEEIHKLNDELEQRVTERTAQLEMAVKELEAFSYSVSHDLRAPLRSMDGFSRILLEEYAQQLPSEPQRYLHQVRDSAQKMSYLIDDLLAFSRLSRQPLNKQPVMMKDLVEQSLKSLEDEQKGRQIEIEVGTLPDSKGDPTMLRQVWVNLIANAHKFTRNREIAKIEIGSKETDGECVYYVKDNGAGFDMQYADRLFGVFQRLHTEREFEGTGVGLAIVQRIVQRHDGRVWAEGQVDQGATFYFVLPSCNESAAV